MSCFSVLLLLFFMCIGPPGRPVTLADGAFLYPKQKFIYLVYKREKEKEKSIKLLNGKFF